MKMLKVKRDNSHCVVPQCNSTGGKNPHLSFFLFPQISYSKNRNVVAWNELQLRRRQEWIKILKIDKEISNRSVVCSKHFKDTDFTKTAKKNRRLVYQAMPSLFLPVSPTENKNQQLRIQKYVEEKENSHYSLTKNCVAVLEIRPYNSHVKDEPPDEMNESNGILRTVEDPLEEQLNDIYMSDRTLEMTNTVLQLNTSSTKWKQFVNIDIQI